MNLSKDGWFSSVCFPKPTKVTQVLVLDTKFFSPSLCNVQIYIMLSILPYVGPSSFAANTYSSSFWYLSILFQRKTLMSLRTLVKRWKSMKPPVENKSFILLTSPLMFWVVSVIIYNSDVILQGKCAYSWTLSFLSPSPELNPLIYLLTCFVTLRKFLY